MPPLHFRRGFVCNKYRIKGLELLPYFAFANLFYPKKEDFFVVNTLVLHKMVILILINLSLTVVLIRLYIY